MGKGFPLFLLIPIYLIMMMFTFYLKWVDVNLTAEEDYHIKKVVNYCVDAAVEEMLGASDLGMDYADWGKVKIDPKLALDTYVDVFCLNYGMALGTDSRNLVKSAYLPVFIVAAYDGYYVYEVQKVNEEGDYELTGSPKLPYTYVVGSNTYALNMGHVDCYVFTGDERLQWTGSPVSAREGAAIINNRISDDLRFRIDQAYAHGWASSLYIPSDVTTFQVTNPITRPSVLAFMDNVDASLGKKVSAFGIAGARVTEARAVAAYTRNGQKYYSYTDLLPADKFTATEENSDNYIEAMFMDVFEAANAGYHHDGMYMNK